MTLFGALVVLSAIVMLVPLALFLWVSLRYPSAWRQIKESNADRVELNGTNGDFILAAGLFVGGAVLLWPAFQICCLS